MAGGSNAKVVQAERCLPRAGAVGTLCATVIGRFRPYRDLVRPTLPQFWAGVLAGILAGASSGAGMPLMMKEVFPVIFADDAGSKVEPSAWLSGLTSLVPMENDGVALILVACMMLPVVFFFRGLGTFLSAYFVGLTGVSFLEALRLKSFTKLQRLPLAFHAKNKEGDIVSRLMTDSLALQQAVVQASVDLIVQPFTLVFAISALVYMSLTNSAVGVLLAALISVPLCVLPIRIIGKKLLKKARKLQQETGDLTAVLSENLASQPEIRAYNMEKAQIASFADLGRKFVRSTMKTIKYKQLTSPMVEIVSAVGVAFAIYYGSRQGLTLNQFIPVVAALYFCYEPVKKLGSVQNRLRQGEASLQRIEHILDADLRLEEKANPATWTEVRGAVEFRDVSFHYDEGEPVFEGLSFSVEPGTMVALVGPSGAGKTTIVSLLERFYDVDAGMVMIDGLDVRDVAMADLRDRIGYVSQHPVLFSGTIAENILIGRPSASREDVVAAAKMANAHEFIEGLPHGYDTVLGLRGSGLSGGQKQRVAIARACLKDAPILILDEATSALDAENEGLVQEALTQLMIGRTTLVIAHRFSSIRNADRILVFEKGPRGGHLTGDGTHHELMDSHAIYAQLYDQQTQVR